ncbi:DUF1056 family protein [Limosilactobacillus reuteri]|uniref:DUF1056 family protein n=1 Tax=Limosilactobacillus reuteri TaxID=1598 RepID=UPI002D1FA4CB|nr:DUF1056 family protein [Limosilactobacillus reuteri]MCC4501840.1 DUF1056 family protein [Limosilactobacillus reuteri]
MIIKMFKQIWHVFDILCFLIAIGLAVCGFFMLNFIAGIFSLAVAFVLVGLLTELIATIKQSK